MNLFIKLKFCMVILTLSLICGHAEDIDTLKTQLKELQKQQSSLRWGKSNTLIKFIQNNEEYTDVKEKVNSARSAEQKWLLKQAEQLEGGEELVLKKATLESEIKELQAAPEKDWKAINGKYPELNKVRNSIRKLLADNKISHWSNPEYNNYTRIRNKAANEYWSKILGLFEDCDNDEAKKLAVDYKTNAEKINNLKQAIKSNE